MRRSVKIVAASTAGLFLMLASGQTYGAVMEYEVLLIPQGNAGGTLQAHLDFGQSCNANQHIGCMNFQADIVGVITFRLPGPKDKIACNNPANPHKSAHRVITEIEVTATPDNGNPTGKGDFSGVVAANSWLRQYAFPQADNDGYIYKVDKNQGLARVAVINMNSHPAAQGTRQFWYKITVEDCSSNFTWTTDPRGDNKGLN